MQLGQLFKTEIETVEQAALKLYYLYKKVTSSSVALSAGWPLLELQYWLKNTLYFKYWSSYAVIREAEDTAVNVESNTFCLLWNIKFFTI